MDLKELRFIPKQNTRNHDDSTLDSLVKIKQNKEINWVIRRDEDDYLFKKGFLIGNDENYGYTVALSPNDEIILLRTKRENPIAELEPKFLKGMNPTPRMRSTYASLLFNIVFPNEKLFQCEILENNIWKIVVAKEEEDTTEISKVILTSIKKDVNPSDLTSFLEKK